MLTYVLIITYTFSTIQTTAMDVAGTGVTCNAINPGVIDTHSRFRIFYFVNTFCVVI